MPAALLPVQHSAAPRGAFWPKGASCARSFARGAELETLFYTENALEKCPELAALPGEHYLVEDHVADKLADVGTHQGVFGVFRTPVHTLGGGAPRWAVSGTGAGAGPWQRGHFAAQRSGLWI